MPTYVVTAPDGKEYEVNAPDGATKDQALLYFQENWKPPEPTITPRKTLERWGEVAVDAIGNLPKSAAHFVEGITDTISDPEKTVTAIKDVALGGAAKLLPESIAPNARLSKGTKQPTSLNFTKTAMDPCKDLRGQLQKILLAFWLTLQLLLV